MKRIYSIIDFGAVPDTEYLQSEPIQKAIDAAYSAGGGEVVIPRGKFILGGIRLRSGVTLRLLKGANLLGSVDPADYDILKNDKIEPFDRELFDKEKIAGEAYGDVAFLKKWFHSLIKAYHAKDIAIIAEDGALINGKDCYDPMGEEGYRGPHCICFIQCENVLIKNISIRQSANWACNMWYNKNLTFDGVSVDAGHDGVDFFASENVTVKNCSLHTGDDCIAGFGNRNVEIFGCTLNSSCSAFRFGGTNVFIHDCNAYGPGKYCHRYSLTPEEKACRAPSYTSDQVLQTHYRNNMLSFFTYYCDYRIPVESADNILIKNCKISNCDRFLHFNFSGNERWQSGGALTGIAFENIVAENIKLPLTAYGDKEKPVSLRFKNCNFSFLDCTERKSFLRLANFRYLLLENVRIANLAVEDLIHCYSKESKDVELLLKNVEVNQDHYREINYVEDIFSCGAI